MPVCPAVLRYAVALPGHAMLCGDTPSHALLCCVMLCYATICHAMPCCASAMLCCAMLRYAMLRYAMLCYAMQLGDFLGPKVDKVGGMMAMADVYCLFNRARGTELVSPDDLLQACTCFPQAGVPLTIKQFSTGALVVQSRSHSTEQVCMMSLCVCVCNLRRQIMDKPVPSLPAAQLGVAQYLQGGKGAGKLQN